MHPWKVVLLAVVAPNTEFHIAPMQCYTNRQLRTLFHRLSPSAIKWTEMEKVDDLLPDIQQALKQRLGDPNKHKHIMEPNLVLQLGSNDPQKVKQCVRTAMQHYNLREINLNCGCPAIESGGAATYGASLMKDPSLTAQLVTSCRSSMMRESSSSVNVSVKCRIAVLDHAEDLRPLQEQDYDYLSNYISSISNAGANHVILHARPAVLSGLSPVKNRIVPSLDYVFCERIAADFPSLKVTLNGGIASLSQLKSLQTQETIAKSGISSHMAGRWILRRPLDLVGVEALLSAPAPALQTNPVIETSFTVAQRAIEDYLDDCMYSRMTRDLSHSVTTADLCLPLFLIVEQLREDYDSDDNYDNDDDPSLLFSYEEMEFLHDILQDGILQLASSGSGGNGGGGTPKSGVNFKRLSTSFKSLVGTKVVNKWKRNRAEL
jgi:tRNA-dihydrouridine synthase A